ncbi:MAG: hypothetical protein ABUL62_07180 [Myxococcales bacterium]
MKSSPLVASMLAALTALAHAHDAAAAERHFGYSYESSTLRAGQAELQPWSTVRLGRADYYNRIDARLGFELGLVKNLQGALFWNASSVTEDLRLPGASVKSRLSDTELDSLSVQLKYKLSDSIADALGSALFVEGSTGPLQASFEGRLILDKQLGSFVLDANLSGGSVELWELRSSTLGSFDATLGAGYYVTPSFVASLEVRNENGFSANFDRSVLYLGPTVSFVSTRYWLTLAVQPQLVAFKGATEGHDLDLSQNEYLQTRLMLGLAL